MDDATPRDVQLLQQQSPDPQPFVHLQLHDDVSVSGFPQHDQQLVQDHALYASDDSYYGYYDALPPNTPQASATALAVAQAAQFQQQFPPRHQHHQQQLKPHQHQPDQASGKRPLRPSLPPSASGPTTTIASSADGLPLLLSAPSVASSHVRPIAKNNASAVAASPATFVNPAITNQSAFINKLYTMLEEADQSLISWDETGTFFIVKNTTGEIKKN
ncbi:hypothetical protein HDU83_008132 [Entophlyctis luteolus]|nr:hypothetical protein HDU83_008132 [Entophlyctis luteolus]KAJ3391437.1 hypothetical protein HDU84_005996 [Entophlyctis sp. JEL0112]